MIKMAKQQEITAKQLEEIKEERKRNRDKNIDKRLKATKLYGERKKRNEVALETGFSLPTKNLKHCHINLFLDLLKNQFLFISIFFSGKRLKKNW